MGSTSVTDNKVAIVTAAAGAGIGAAIARRLAEDGMNVVITDVHEARSRKLSEELSAATGRDCPAYLLDVADFDAAERVARSVNERLGRIDVLVNNAGWSKIEKVSEMSR